MSDLFLNKLAFCVLGTGLLMTGLNEASHAPFPDRPVTIVEPPPEIPQPPVAPRSLHELFAVADAEAGKAVSNKCEVCHRFEPGAAPLVGPPLYGVVGRDIASVEGFRYSDEPQSLMEIDGAWTYERLDRFLEIPKRFAPGTAMTFIGIRKTADRINLIAYLRTLTAGDPLPLP